MNKNDTWLKACGKLVVELEIGPPVLVRRSFSKTWRKVYFCISFLFFQAALPF